ncbi:MAG: hypothetical protein Fur0039_00970 [Rhodocyclaceae bacterium]
MNMPASPLGIDCRDPQQCMALVAALPLTQPAQVQASLTTLLDGLANDPPPAPSYLQILEMARPAVAFVQESAASRYAQRPVVPGSSEEQSLERVVRLWNLMAKAYAQVAGLGGASPEIQSRLALILHRCVHYAGRRIIEYYVARREVPRGCWSELFGYYSSAEDWGIGEQPVAEPLNEFSHSQSCAQALAAVLLADLGNPYGRSPRELGWLIAWSQRFSVFTDLHAAGEGSDARLYAVDLARDCGPRPLHLLAPGPELRHLETTRLTAEMHRVAAQLKSGVSPDALGLGEGAFEPYAGRLLVSLFRPWCVASSPRRFQRHAVAAGARAELCFGFEAIHYFVSGGEFVQPAHVRMYSRTEFETIATFGDQVDPKRRLHVQDARVAYSTETWEVADESVTGFRLNRPKAGECIQLGQLLAIRPPGCERFLLCVVSWLMYETAGGLRAGVRVLPGVPEAVCVRRLGPAVSHSERYVRAFRLPEMPALREPACLVLPKGWFEPERVIDLYVERTLEARLDRLVDQGFDFERISYGLVRRAEALPQEPARARSGR